MQQFNKFRDTRGFLTLWNTAVRFRDMITLEAQRRASILTFWKKHGGGATKEAFRVGRATLFRWQKELWDGGGKLEALNPKSRAPHTRRKRIVPKAVENLIIKERKMEKSYFLTFHHI